MRDDDRTPESANDDRYLDALLKDYDLARSDDRTWFPLIGTVIALLVTGIGAIAVGLSAQRSLFTCAFTSSQTCGGMRVGGTLAVLPVIPLAGVGIAALLAMVAAARAHYMRGLEREIRRVLRIPDPGVSSAGEEAPYVLCWTDLATEINGARRGQVLYRLIVHGLFIGCAVIYIGLCVIIGTRVTRGVAALMTGGYGVISLLLFGAMLKVALGSKAIWDETTASYLARGSKRAEPGTQLTWYQRLRGVPEERRLVSYLLLPRKWVVVLRLVLLIATT